METLSYRRTRADLLEIYRITSGLHAIDQDCKCSICPEKTMLQPSLSSATRGHSKKLQIQMATGVRKHFFSDRSAPTWNKLSEATISSPNINLFKSNLRKDLGHQPEDTARSYKSKWPPELESTSSQIDLHLPGTSYQKPQSLPQT